MIRFKSFYYCVAYVVVGYCCNLLFSGCAQVGMPTGGLKDSLAPVLVSAVPKEKITRFAGNKIVLTFDEYVEVQDVQNNVMVSPLPKQNPVITSKLKTVTIKLRDTLKENTTYAVNFGYAIKDVNEGNPYRNYTYVFSTGDVIDSLRLSGNVILAETGKLDTTIAVLLYKDAPDSAVRTRKPDYLTKLDSKGEFTFTNLAAGKYQVYALKDGDGGKTYNAAIELFAFNDAPVQVSDSTAAVTLYAYAAEKDNRPPTGNAPRAAPAKNGPEKKLKFTSPVQQGGQSLLGPLELSFSAPLKEFVKERIRLTDTSFRSVNIQSIVLDSTKKLVSITVPWAEETEYRLLIAKDAFTDTLGNQLSKADTVKFKSKSRGDYGNLLIRFSNYDAAKHPVLQLFKADVLVKSAAITAATWSDRLFEPGEYEIRILYDRNNNGKWDPGNFSTRQQPERVITTEKKITVKANWDNEKEVKL